MLAAKAPPNRAYNVGSDESVSIAELARITSTTLSSRPERSAVERPAKLKVAATSLSPHPNRRHTHSGRPTSNLRSRHRPRTSRTEPPRDGPSHRGHFQYGRLVHVAPSFSFAKPGSLGDLCVKAVACFRYFRRKLHYCFSRLSRYINTASLFAFTTCEGRSTVSPGRMRTGSSSPNPCQARQEIADKRYVSRASQHRVQFGHLGETQCFIRFIQGLQ